jgi:hypothetical protein
MLRIEIGNSRADNFQALGIGESVDNNERDGKGVTVSFTMHTNAAVSTSAGSGQRGWTNIKPVARESAVVSLSDRKEQGGHNVPPAKSKKRGS